MTPLVLLLLLLLLALLYFGKLCIRGPRRKRRRKKVNFRFERFMCVVVIIERAPPGGVCFRTWPSRDIGELCRMYGYPPQAITHGRPLTGDVQHRPTAPAPANRGKKGISSFLSCGEAAIGRQTQNWVFCFFFLSNQMSAPSPSTLCSIRARLLSTSYIRL